MNDYDLYDVLADLAYGLSPRTRENRTLAFRYKHSSWLAGMPAPAGEAIKAIADQFSIGGTEGLENPHIWQVPEVVAAGDLKALAAAGEPRTILRETNPPFGGKESAAAQTHFAFARARRRCSSCSTSSRH